MQLTFNYQTRASSTGQLGDTDQIGIALFIGRPLTVSVDHALLDDLMGVADECLKEAFISFSAMPTGAADAAYRVVDDVAGLTRPVLSSEAQNQRTSSSAGKVLFSLQCDMPRPLLTILTALHRPSCPFLSCA